MKVSAISVLPVRSGPVKRQNSLLLLARDGSGCCCVFNFVGGAEGPSQQQALRRQRRAEPSFTATCGPGSFGVTQEHKAEASFMSCPPLERPWGLFSVVGERGMCRWSVQTVGTEEGALGAEGVDRRWPPEGAQPRLEPTSGVRTFSLWSCPSANRCCFQPLSLLQPRQGTRDGGARRTTPSAPRRDGSPPDRCSGVFTSLRRY